MVYLILQAKLLLKEETLKLWLALFARNTFAVFVLRPEVLPRDYVRIKKHKKLELNLNAVPVLHENMELLPLPLLAYAVIEIYTTDYKCF